MMGWPLRKSVSTTASSDATRDSMPSTPVSSTSPRPSSNGDGVPIIPESEILQSPTLSALYYRAMDAKLGIPPILGDNFAAELADRLVLTGPNLGTEQDIASDIMCIMAMIVDVYCLKFIEAHRDGAGCTILNLTTGFDTRFLRLKSRPNVRWVQVDKPEFTHMRQRVFSPSSNLYRPRTAQTTSSAKSNNPTIYHDEKMDSKSHKDSMVLELSTSDLTDTDSWLPLVPADRPTLVIMELMAWAYPRADFTHVMRSVVEHFKIPGCTLMFDVLGRLSVLLFRCKALPPVRRFTFSPQWHCDDPVELGMEIHPCLQLVEKKGYRDALSEENDDWMSVFYGGKLRSKLVHMMPGFGNNLEIMVYQLRQERAEPQGRQSLDEVGE